MKSLERENELLAVELGREHGHARYQWQFSENCYLPMRDRDGKRDQVADYKTGLIEVRDRFELRKTAPHLNRQWVLCRWMDPGDEAVWKSIFGAFVQYPRNGYYAPTNVELAEGISPWDSSEEGQTLTWYVIHEFKEQEKKTYADHLREGEVIVERREADKERLMEDMILDLRLPFGHVPGIKGDGVSLPTPGKELEYEAAFGGQELSK